MYLRHSIPLHFHFEATFGYRPQRFEGELREATERFDRHWASVSKGKKRYAFTVDIMGHVICDNQTPPDIGVEVKFTLRDNCGR